MIGAYFGLKKEGYTYPVRINQIARVIPPHKWFEHPLLMVMMGGLLPFGAVSIEVFFLMSSLWLHQYYYVFGFLFAVLIILVATCAEVSIVLCYLQLRKEDWKWWWPAFLSAASSGVYLFLYSIWYFFSKLNYLDSAGGSAPSLVYFAYMLMISFAFSLATGAVGFYSCFFFTRTIFAAVKVD